MSRILILILILSLSLSFSLNAVGTEKLTGTLYRDQEQWFFSVGDGSEREKSVYRVLELPPKTRFTRQSVHVAVEGEKVACEGSVPCLKLHRLTPALYDPLAPRRKELEKRSGTGTP